jgi:hypothetical protein
MTTAIAENAAARTIDLVSRESLLLPEIWQLLELVGLDVRVEDVANELNHVYYLDHSRFNALLDASSSATLSPPAEGTRSSSPLGSSREESIRSMVSRPNLNEEEFRNLCRLTNRVFDPTWLERDRDGSLSIRGSAASAFLETALQNRQG